MSNLSRHLRNLPTHATYSDFISTILPPHTGDIQPIYHQPLHPYYDPGKAAFQHVILSITPTPGFYQRLEELSKSSSPIVRKPACFLHRPFNLDRRAVPRGVMIQASHKRFDELLTVGWNEELARRLGLDLTLARCIQGYKSDPDRRIGLVAPFVGGTSRSLREIHVAVQDEFGVGDIHPVSEEGFDLATPLRGIAIMNAFGPDEVIRVVECAVQNMIVPEGGHHGLLYLTGEPKEPGIASLKEQYKGMFAMCVGHRPAEEWGIKFLATRLKQAWPEIDIHVILEEDEPPPVRKKTKIAPARTTKTQSDSNDTNSVGKPHEDHPVASVTSSHDTG